MGGVTSLTRHDVNQNLKACSFCVQRQQAPAPARAQLPCPNKGRSSYLKVSKDASKVLLSRDTRASLASEIGPL